MAFGRRFAGRSLFFSLLADKLASATRSTVTASATMHLLRRGDVPGRSETPAHSRALRGRDVSGWRHAERKGFADLNALAPNSRFLKSTDASPLRHRPEPEEAGEAGPDTGPQASLRSRKHDGGARRRRDPPDLLCSIAGLVQQNRSEADPSSWAAHISSCL